MPDFVRIFCNSSDLIFEALRVVCCETLWIGVMRRLASECRQTLVNGRPADKRASLLAAFSRCEEVSAILAALYPNYGVGDMIRPARLVYGPPAGISE
jgi:hypothetical protein